MNRLVIRTTLLLAVLTAGTAHAAAAQGSPSSTRIWAAAGLGAGLPSTGGDGIANLAQVVLQRNAHHFALRGLVLHDLDRPTDEIGEVGVLYGRTRPWRSGHIALGAGLSLVAFEACPDDDDACFPFGVPLIAETAITRGFLGLGLQAFGNINNKASYAGVVLFIQAGKLR